MISNILHINTADIEGGAAQSGYRIHSSFRKRGLTSRMVVRYKTSSDPNVKQIASFPPLRWVDKAFGKIWSLSGYQYLFYPSSYLLLRDAWFKYADVIQLYNLHGNFFTPLILPSMARRKPVVWRLSDMWPLTGHCAYSYDCDRWKTGCGECPLLDEYPPLVRDTTAFLWQFKKSIYDRSQFSIVAPSRWIEKLAGQSPLLNRFPIHYVPNGVNPDIFHPHNKKDARRIWNVPQDRFVILLQDMGTGGERKGRLHLPGIVSTLRQQFPGRVAFLVFGAGSMAWEGQPDVIPVGLVRGQEKMATLYNACDLFIFPTEAENLANTALESMACGIPVATFDAGGMRDVIQNNINGFLVPPSNVAELVRAAASVAADSSKWDILRKAAIATITERFTDEREATQLLDLYSHASDAYHSREK